MALRWLRTGLTLRRTMRSDPPLVGTLGFFTLASDGWTRRLARASWFPTAATSLPAASLSFPRVAQWGLSRGVVLRARAVRRPTSTPMGRWSIVAKRDWMYLTRQEGDSTLVCRLYSPSMAVTLRSSRVVWTALPVTWLLRAGRTRLPACTSIGAATCTSPASARASSQSWRRRRKLRKDTNEARSSYTRQGAQVSGRRKSRRRPIAPRPMDLAGVGNVVVPERVLEPVFARTSTLPREGWPAGSWGHGVGAPYVFSSASFAGASTPLSDGMMPLPRDATAMVIPRKPCVGTSRFAAVYHSTHDFRRRWNETDAVTSGTEWGRGRGGAGRTCSGWPRAPLTCTLNSVMMTHLTVHAVNFILAPFVVSPMSHYGLDHILGSLCMLRCVCEMPHGDALGMADGRRPSHFISQGLRCHRIARRASELMSAMMTAAPTQTPTVRPPPPGPCVPPPPTTVTSTWVVLGGWAIGRGVLGPRVMTTM